MFHHVLFPVDFSERCACAAHHVQAMAERFEAKVTMLFVMQPFLYQAPAEPEITYQPPFRPLENQFLDMLEEFRHRVIQSQKACCLVKRGEPAAAITACAREQGADLIMMPSHGRGPFRRLLLGSVAAKVLHDAAGPVWTGAHMQRPERAHLPCRNVLCAVDLGPRTVSVMKWASDLARKLEANLELVHVTPEIAPASEWTSAYEVNSEFEERGRKGLAACQEQAGLNVPASVASGAVGAGVRAQAELRGADLIVIGRSGEHAGWGRLREHAYSIIRQAPCPVVSV